jgi:hypothetical protein
MARVMEMELVMVRARARDLVVAVDNSMLSLLVRLVGSCSLGMCRLLPRNQQCSCTWYHSGTVWVMGLAMVMEVVVHLLVVLSRMPVSWRKSLPMGSKEYRVLGCRS